jgi:hypothetical protein
MLIIIDILISYPTAYAQYIIYVYIYIIDYFFLDDITRHKYRGFLKWGYPKMDGL